MFILFQEKKQKGLSKREKLFATRKQAKDELFDKSNQAKKREKLFATRKQAKDELFEKSNQAKNKKYKKKTNC